MRRFRSKWIAILATLALLATLLVPMVGPAAAAATYSAVVTKVQPGVADQYAGRILVEIPVAELSSGDYFVLRLPTDFDFSLTIGNNKSLTSTVESDVYNVGGEDGVKIKIPQVSNAFYSSTSGYNVSGFKVDVIAKNEIKIYVEPTAVTNTAEKTGYFYVILNKIDVASGYSGDIYVTIEGKSGSPFGDGKVIVAQCGSGIVNITVDSVKTITTSKAQIDNIRVKEDRQEAFSRGKDIKLKLPSGYKWQRVDTSGNAVGDPTATNNIMVYDGKKNNNAANIAPSDYAISLDDNGRTLVLTSQVDSSSSAYLILKDLGVVITDETLVKPGDVEVTVSGSASVNPGTLIVAKYGEYSVNVYAVGKPKEVIAGRAEQEIGKFAIEESIAGSLLDKRTITLTLVGGAKWTKGSNDKVKNVSHDISESKGDYRNVPADWTIIGTSGDVARITINGTSKDAIKAVFKGAYINVSPSASGEIKIVVSGTAGVTGEVIVAKVVKPVTVSIDGTPAKIVAGTQGNELPPIVVAETKAEGVAATVYDSSSGKYVNTELRLEFPMDIRPSLPTSVEVTEGDLVIDPNSVRLDVTSDGRWFVGVTIKSTSSKPSKVVFKGIKLSAFRTVPEGPVNVAVKGTAVVQTTSDFPGYTSIATTKVAEVVTPAPVEQKATATFKVGDTKFTVNGVQQTMDVAPYVKNGRTYLPVRYVAMALGVAPENIYYADGVVTLLKGGIAVQLTIGSNVLKVKGAEIKMDVAAELSNGRTMLPFRWVAQALGATVSWDEATQTVSMTL